MSINPPRAEASIAERESVYNEASRTATWGLGVNVVLVMVKSIGGFLTGSAALIADAVNSAGDVASSLTVHGALWIAQQDEDDDHPYGHTKAETIGALSIAILIAFSAGALAVETCRRLGDELEIPPISAAIIAGVCAVAKEILYLYTNKVGKHLDSRALQAAAWDHRSDAICSGTIAASLLVAPFLGSAGKYVDLIAALGVCVLLVLVGIRIFQTTAGELMDQQADAGFTDKIRRQAEKMEEVCRIEQLRVRKSGLEYFVDIHVEVEGDLTVSEGHRIGHNVKDDLLAEFPRIRDVLVHIEPEHPADD